MFKISGVLMVCCGLGFGAAGTVSAASLSLSDAERSFENVDGDLTATEVPQEASGSVPGLSSYSDTPQAAGRNGDASQKPIKDLMPDLFKGPADPLFGKSDGLFNSGNGRGLPFKL